MANVRIKDLSTTASTTASDDFFGVDGATNGTRKLNAYSPTFGGNLTVSGTGTSSVSGRLQTGVGVANSAFQLLNSTSGSGASDGFALELSGANAYFTNYENGPMYWFGGSAGATQLMSLSASGNLTVSGTGTSSVAGTWLVGTTSDGGQKLQVAGTVAKTAAGPTTIAIASNEAYNLRDEGRLFIVGNASAGSRYLGLEYYDVGNGAYRNVAAVPNGGNLLVGTTTDGGQKLQVSGTAAIAGTLTLTTAASSKVILTNTAASGVTWELNSFSDGDFFLTHAGVVNALQVSKTSGNATFAGNVTLGSSTSVQHELRTATSNASRLISAFDTNRWYINSTYSGTGTAYKLEFLTANTTALSLDTSQNATFAGNIKTAAPSGGTAATWRLGTVASVSPTSPNRTIEVQIGGTTYYIHAKTTND